MKKNFPHKYYFYGSHDSTDEDVIISIPRDLMPELQEDRKRLVKSMEEEYNLPWNATLAVIEDGIIVDTIFPKSWIDSLNNSLFNTYNNHLDKQVYENPIEREVSRHKLLAIYKCVRTLMAMLSRTHYRTTVKPVLKGCHPFEKKIEALKQIDYSTIETFNQPNMDDTDVWKVIAFYMAQNLALIKKGVEIYTKEDLVKNYPLLKRFIYRVELNSSDITILNHYLDNYIYMVESYGDYITEETTLICGDEKIDMKNEISIIFEKDLQS
jgi:hypothetical protein